MGLTTLWSKAKSSFDLTPPQFIIVCLVHPLISAPKGYYQHHPDLVWRIVKDRQKATVFGSRRQAELCATGSSLHCYTDYKVESLGLSLPN